MLKILIFTILFYSISSSNLVEDSDSSFITKLEYGEMLYNNPRGIGCNLCHGKKGEGMFIASYKHKKKFYDISAPNIINVSLIQFKKVVNSTKNRKSIMPKYFLTDEELDSIYFYLVKQDKD